MKRYANQLGFTLVELMVVIVIIGILTTIVAGSFAQAKLKSRDSQRKNNIAQLQRSLEAYYNDHGTYPAEANGLVLGLAWGTTFQDNNGTVYMVELPNDTKQPSIQFYYHTDATGTKYQIFTKLENSQDTDIMVLSTPPTCGTTPCNYGRSSSNAKATDTI